MDGPSKIQVVYISGKARGTEDGVKKEPTLAKTARMGHPRGMQRRRAEERKSQNPWEAKSAAPGEERKSRSLALLGMTSAQVEAKENTTTTAPVILGLFSLLLLRLKFKKGIPARITSRPSVERTGRTTDSRSGRWRPVGRRVASRTMTPPRIHAANTKATEPTARAMSLVTRKTPVPMVSPTTMAVADQTPRARTNCEERRFSRRGICRGHGRARSLLSSIAGQSEWP